MMDDSLCTTTCLCQETIMNDALQQAETLLSLMFKTGILPGSKFSGSVFSSLVPLMALNKLRPKHLRVCVRGFTCSCSAPT